MYDRILILLYFFVAGMLCGYIINELINENRR